jgi:hypothetical protein
MGKLCLCIKGEKVRRRRLQHRERVAVLLRKRTTAAATEALFPPILHTTQRSSLASTSDPHQRPHTSRTYEALKDAVSVLAS